MSDTGAAAAPRRARLRLAASLASLALGGAVTFMAAPASAAPGSAAVPSRPAAPVSLRSAAAPFRAALPAASSPTAAFFGIGPASATAIDNRPYFAWSDTPSGVLTDHAAIVNFGAQPVTLQVFAADAVSLPHGGTGFESQSQSTAGPAGWITLGIPPNYTLQLPPKTQVIVPITLHVPAGADPGDHVGAIIAALTSTIVSKNHARVRLVQQVASRVILRVSGPVHPGLTVTGGSVAYDNPVNPVASGKAMLRFTVRNTGNVLLGGRQTVTVHGLFGAAETAGGTVNIPVMLPGGSDSETVTVSGIYPEVMMHGEVTITPVTVAGENDPGVATYSASIPFWAFPQIPTAVVIVIVLAGLGILLLRIYRPRRGGTTAASGDSKAEPATKVEA
jgi:hypothetical protein